MATFEPISYTYVPTPPRSKSTTAHRKIPLEPIGTLHKNKRVKQSSVVAEKPKPVAVAAAVIDEQSRFQVETSIIYSDNEENNDNDYFPTVEELLYSTLHKEGFATKDSRPDHIAQGIDDMAFEEIGDSVDFSRLTPDDSPGTSRGDPIILKEDESDDSEVEVDYHNHRGESADPDAALFSSTETTLDSRISVHSSHLQGCDDIKHHRLAKTAQCLQLAEEEASAFNAIRRYSASSRPSSEPLHDSSRTDDLCKGCARFEALISHCSKPSTQYNSSQVGRPLTSGSVSNEGELLSHTPGVSTDASDKENEQQQHPEENNANDDDKSNVVEEHDSDINDGHREVNNAAAAQIAKGGSDTQLSSKEDESPLRAEPQRPLPSHDLLSQPSQQGIGSPSDTCSDSEISNTRAKTNKEQRRSRPLKRKRPSSPYESTQKKRRHHLQQRPTRQPKPRSRSQQHCAEGAIPSPALSTPQALDVELPSDPCIVGGLSRDVRPMLTEITFRPHSLHECSFTAIIRTDHSGLEFSFSQVAKLIKNIGYIGKIDDFTFKPLTQNSLLLVGFSGTMGTSSQASCIQRDTISIQLQRSKAVDAKALAICKGELLRTDDILSDSDPDLSSDDDDGSSTEDEQGRSSPRKHSAWLPLDEQRLLAYRKEGKSWSWIFRKFPSRTPGAVRTRCHIVQARLPKWHRNENDEDGGDVVDEAKPKRRPGRPPKKKQA